MASKSLVHISSGKGFMPPKYWLNLYWLVIVGSWITHLEAVSMSHMMFVRAISRSLELHLKFMMVEQTTDCEFHDDAMETFLCITHHLCGSTGDQWIPLTKGQQIVNPSLSKTPINQVHLLVSPSLVDEPIRYWWTITHRNHRFSCFFYREFNPVCAELYWGNIRKLEFSIFYYLLRLRGCR